MLCASGQSGWGGSLTLQGAGVYGGRGASPASSGSANLVLPCPASDLVWNRLKRSGYVTGWVSDECADVLADVFGRSPGAGGGIPRADAADYEVGAAFCHPEYDHRGAWSNFAGPYSMRRRCIAGRYVHEYVFEYARDFITHHAMRGVPWHLFLLLIEAHEGSMAVVALMDAALADFLTWVLTSAVLTHAPIILLMSDHGLHMGPFMEFTRGGRLEHKLPAMYQLVPERWTWWWDVEQKRNSLRRAKTTTAVPVPVDDTLPYYTLHPSAAGESASPFLGLSSSARESALAHSYGLALHENQHALVTAREVYWFLRTIPARVVKDAAAVEEHLREVAWAQAADRVRATHPSPADSRSSESDSLPLSFLTTIPQSRTCAQAGIRQEMCACQAPSLQTE